MEITGSLAALLGLGLASSFAPVLYSAAVLNLSQKRQPLRRTLPLVAGILIAHGLIALLLLGALFIPLLRDTVRNAGSVGRGALGLGHDLLVTFDPAIAVVLVVLGIAAVVWWRSTDYSPPRIGLSGLLGGRIGHKSLFAVGFLRALLHATGIVSLALAVRIASRYGFFAPVLMLGVVAVGALPYAVIFVVRRTSPDLFSSLRTKLKQLTSFDPRVLAGVLLLAAGTYFAYQSVTGL